MPLRGTLQVPGPEQEREPSQQPVLGLCCWYPLHSGRSHPL